MKRELHTIHSDALGQDMSMIVYGEKGYPIVAFQTQDHTCESFEQDGLLEPLAEYVEGGRIQLFSVDNADQGSWSDLAGDKAERAQRQEDYFRFVTDELLPQVHKLNGSDLRPLAMGCSMGATHAALAALRRPDLFQGCLSLSGVYRASYFFGDWSNPTLYDNDIVSFLPNMPLDHPYVELYRHRSLLFCVGQGAFEDGQDDVRAIDHELDRLGVPHWCDFWGYDVNHDPYWWKKQLRYFMPLMLEDIQKELASEGVDVAAKTKPVAKAEAKPAAKATAKPAAAKKAAPKAVAKPQAKASAKASEKPAAKAEPKAKPAAQGAAKSAAAMKAPAKAAPATKAAEKPEATKAASAKSDAKTAPKATVAKAAAKPAAKAEPAAKAAAKATTKTTPKTAAKAAAKPEPKTAAKATVSAKAAPAKATAAAAAKPVFSPKPAAKAAKTEAKAVSPKPASKTTTAAKPEPKASETSATKPAATKTVAAKPAATKSTAAKSAAGKASAKGGTTRTKTVRSSRKKK
uniref:esterase family protein n=1 Tax=Olsenella porci TaxID=2652279 RepID=UPI001E4542FE|nr:alpha/beta hydrolase-fold protein [Olsenella porci]